MRKFLHRREIIISLIFFLIVRIAYLTLDYEHTKAEILKSADQRLLSSALSTHAVLGDQFVERAKGPDAITASEDQRNIQILSRIAKSSDVKYVYLMILDHNMIHFIASSALEKELKTGKNLTHYYDAYDYNANIFNAFRTKQVIFDEPTEDQWGYTRSVFVPFTTSTGKRYIVGVDIDLEMVTALAWQQTFEEIIKSILILLSLTPLLYLFNLFRKDSSMQMKETERELHQLNQHLQAKINDQTQELKEHFYKDSLTLLPNRNKLQEDLLAPSVFGVALINIDSFKEVNDFFGIELGDSVLIQFADFLNHYHPTYRVSGDEFAMIFDHLLPKEHILHTLEFILQKVQENLFTIQTHSISLRLSMGLAFGHHANLISADIALNQAKKKKIPIAVYDENEEIKNQFHYNLEMVKTIKHALENSKIVCHYQPLYSIQDDKITKYETLVRLLDERNNLVYPVSFLELAEKTKHYPQIAFEVVRQACDAFATRPESFSINLSNTDMCDESTVAFIIETITQTQTASRVVFEILESEGIENFDQVSSFIERVKALGARIAIDDFGTGYSSFENILKLQIDYIKIDGSLIRNIDTNERHAIVVETIVDFAHKIGVQTVAEYVTTEAIFEKVKLLGVDFAQGFYIAKPSLLEQ